VQYGTGALKSIMDDSNASSQTKVYIKSLIDSIERVQQEPD
jgi:hypothetical protein